MRFLTFALGALLLGMQVPLWHGDGGWLHMRELSREVAQLRETTRRQEARRLAVEAEVRDLKDGRQAIEERARYELGMIRADEVFVQVNENAAHVRGPVQTAAVR